MYRFVAIARLSHDDDGTDAVALAQGLGLAFRHTCSWWLFADPAAPILEMGNGTILLGHVFDRRSCRPLGGGWPGLARAPDHTSLAEQIVRDCWGSYLAFGGNPSRNIAFCLRDPSGGIPAFRAERSGQLYVASGLDLLHILRASDADIEWSAMTAQFLSGQMQGPRTCIEGVREITPGGMLTAQDGDRLETQCWTPAKFARAAPDIAMPAAADMLQETILSAVGAWAGVWDRPLIELSGGLDSSIVAAATRRAASSATGVTLVTPGRDGDERRLARMVADHLNMPLAERLRDPLRIDLRRAIAPHLPRPGVRGFSQESDRLICEAADQAGADALFSGGGGDSLFCKLDTAAALQDRFHTTWSPGTLLRTACDTADTIQQTIWSLVRSLYTSWRPRRHSHPSEPRSRLMPDVSADRVIEQSPLLDGMAALLPGRAAHVADLVAIGNHRFGMARASRRPMVFPLMAQPIQEACLALPTWLWVHNGRDRSVAREAFGKLLPESIAFRRSKGRLDAFGHLLFDRHRDELRGLLLDGMLAAEGLLDRDEAERLLASTAPFRTSAFFLLLELADIEAWAQGVRARAWSRN